jgi:WD40 repeat protein
MRYRFLLLAQVFSLAVPTFVGAVDSPDFNRQILPLFRKYCIGCHNAKDAEGGLVLQDFARTLKGGEGGQVIVPGKRAASPLWQRVTASDESRMPPKDQPVPTAEDLALIRRWIDDGAKAPSGGVSETGLVTPKIVVTRKFDEPITSVAFSPNGQWHALAKLHGIEIVGSDSVKQLAGHTGVINEIRFSRDGQWLCVASGETGLAGEATLWRTSDWSRGRVIQGHRDTIYSAQLSPDGNILATASYDRDAITWNIVDGQRLNVFNGHNDPIYGLNFSPNGKLLATASGDRTIKLWDVATGVRLDTFSQPAKDQTTVAFSPDGGFIAAGGADARIRIWQISDTGREGTNPILYARFAHEGPILKLAYSPDGKLLASSSEDLRIKLWETRTYTQVAVLERQSDWVPALAFSPDNQRLLVGRMNGEHQFYPVDPDWIEPKNDLQRLEESEASSSPTLSNSLAETIPQTTEKEPNDTLANATKLPIPGSAKGELKVLNGPSSDIDLYQFEARKGETIVLETNAARAGSEADTKLDVLNSDGRPVLQALLQAVRDSWINFRPIDSSSPDVRLEFWEEMDLNQYVYLSGEVCKTFRAPQGPDSGYSLYSIGGKRRNYFNTSATGHAKDEPAYIVEAFAPNSKIIENGLPVFPLFFSNDDDSERKYGKDSRLIFTVPADGTYFVKVSDVRGFTGEKYFYTITARPLRPDFLVEINTMNPKVPAGSGQRLKFTLNRLDQFDGTVRLDIAGLPNGFQASSPVIFQSGSFETHSVITASSDAPEPTKADWERITVLATGEVGGQLVTRRVGGLGELKLEKPAPIQVALIPHDSKYETADHGLVIEPGTTITAKIVVTRNGHEDDVKFEIDNLPHGIIVDNIGLSGVLVRKKETERQIFLTARPWVPETVRLIHAVAQGVGNQASPAIRLHVRKSSGLATNSITK